VTVVALPSRVGLADLLARLEDNDLVLLVRERKLRVGRKELAEVIADEALAGRVEIRLRPEAFEASTFAALASFGDGERSRWNGDRPAIEQPSRVADGERSKLNDALVLAIATEGPASGTKLALRVGVRKSAALAALNSSERFERVGGGHTTVWRLTGTGREPIRGNGTVEDVLAAVRELQRRLAAYVAEEARA
jgi:hypothetical protein